jgi:hypothetical protein
MRRVAKLVYWLDRHEFIAAGAKNCSVASKGIGIAGDADIWHRGRCESAGLALGSRAGRIKKGGIKIFELLRWRKRSRRATASGLKGAVQEAFAKAESAGSLRSKALTAANSAIRSANVPMPQNRFAMRFTPAICAQTLDARTSSPASVACKKAPGGATIALPIDLIFRHVSAAGAKLAAPKNGPYPAREEDAVKTEKTGPEIMLDLVAIFATLMPNERVCIAAKLKQLSYEKGDTLVEPGTVLQSLFIVGNGVLSVRGVALGVCDGQIGCVLANEVKLRKS